MPAQAGIQEDSALAYSYTTWIPAFAGMTVPYRNATARYGVSLPGSFLPSGGKVRKGVAKVWNDDCGMRNAEYQKI
jgi:hypothetical protein